MADLIVSALAFAGLVIASVLYSFMVRRRGRVRHVRRAEGWDHDMSQSRAVRRFQELEQQDRNARGAKHQGD